MNMNINLPPIVLVLIGVLFLFISVFGVLQLIIMGTFHKNKKNKFTNKNRKNEKKQQTKTFNG